VSPYRGRSLECVTPFRPNLVFSCGSFERVPRPLDMQPPAAWHGSFWWGKAPERPTVFRKEQPVNRPPSPFRSKNAPSGVRHGPGAFFQPVTLFYREDVLPSAKTVRPHRSLAPPKIGRRGSARFPGLSHFFIGKTYSPAKTVRPFGSLAPPKIGRRVVSGRRGCGTPKTLLQVLGRAYRKDRHAQCDAPPSLR